MSVRLYHAPLVPFAPTERLEFQDEESAKEWGHENWPNAWILAEEGDELDRFLDARLCGSGVIK